MQISFTHQNELMEECLIELDNYWHSNNPELAGNSIAFAKFGLLKIVQHQGCYLLWNDADEEAPSPNGKFVPNEIFPNRSHFEDFHNHFHLSEIVTGQEPSIGFLGVGLSITEILYLKLHHDFPNNHFRIFISYPVKSIDDDDMYVRNDCRISFHALRNDEVVFDDLKNYKFEACGIREF